MYKIIISIFIVVIAMINAQAQADSLDFSNDLSWSYNEVNMSGYGWENNTGVISTSDEFVKWTQPSGLVYEWQVDHLSTGGGQVTFVLTEQSGYITFNMNGEVITCQLKINGQEGDVNTFDFKIDGEPQLK